MKDYLPQACPHGDSMILDSEVLMVDLKTGNPLPFGTLGIHKVCLMLLIMLDLYSVLQKSAFKDAVPCLFIFDIIYFNGQSLLERHAACANSIFSLLIRFLIQSNQ